MKNVSATGTNINLASSQHMTMTIKHRYRRCKNRLFKFVYVPATTQLKIGFFSSFSDAAVYSTNEANKAGLKQSIIFRCLCYKTTV